MLDYVCQGCEVKMSNVESSISRQFYSKVTHAIVVLDWQSVVTRLQNFKIKLLNFIERDDDFAYVNKLEDLLNKETRLWDNKFNNSTQSKLDWRSSAAPEVFTEWLY